MKVAQNILLGAKLSRAVYTTVLSAVLVYELFRFRLKGPRSTRRD